MNNKGFTLIELLATISLLAILMLIAVPNVVGVVNKNKNKTYVEDAKKLVSLAEYKIRLNSNYKPSRGQVYCFYMKFLGTEDFESAPNGGCYDENYSYVKVSFSGGKLVYNVQTAEREKCDKDNRGNYTSGFKGGILETDSDNLYGNDATKKVRSSGFNTLQGCSETF